VTHDGGVPGGETGITGEGSSQSPFPLLFSPLRVGPLTLKNRIINSPHQTGFANSGNYTPQLIDYHRERAKGGAALIVSQATSVIPDYIDLWNVDDRIVDQYKDVVAAVGEYGAYYSVELYHPGRLSVYTGEGAAIYEAPSPLPTFAHGTDWRMPHALTTQRIRELVDAFGAAAGRCRRGGVAGVELHFAHGNLAEQFMSPVTNHRTDEWGGPLENRLRFAREVVSAVRAAAGPDMAVGARITGSGLDPGEPDQLDMLEIAGTIDSWGLLDYLSVTMGHYADALNSARNIPNMSFEPGLWARFGKGMKKVVEMPVFLVGRINHPRVAEELLASESCDAVVMARALIADPYLPEKARTDSVEDIRLCVGAMNCLRHLHRGEGIRCIQNPVVSRESRWGGPLPEAATSRRVLVVGGGPAGLESSRVAAVRGHEVTLVERASRLGGQVRDAARAPGRSELLQIVEWLVGQCERANVDVRLGTEATPELVERLTPDAVVVATGSTIDPVSPGDIPVRGVQDALAGEVPSGSHVVLWDEFGDWQGFAVALALADRRVRVDFVTPTMYPGSAVELTNWRIAYERLVSMGVRFHPVTTVASASGQSVTLRSAFANVEEVLGDVDAVVSVPAPRACDQLYDALAGTVGELHLVGDARSPRGIEASIYDGHAVGRVL
jgi:2,4-dienoyl-CoA reductase-like NADH-dependent reductase (Old Yellow Enzyme family)